MSVHHHLYQKLRVVKGKTNYVNFLVDKLKKIIYNGIIRKWILDTLTTN